MNLRIFLASLAGAVVAFFLGWLVYGILLSGFYQANSIHYDGLMKTTMSMMSLVGIFFSCWAYSLMFAIVFGVWTNIRSFGTGFVAGAVISFLLGLSINLYFLSNMNLFNTTLVAVDTVVGAVFNGFIAGIVALVLGMMQKD